MQETTISLAPEVLRAAIQASIQMGPLRTSDPYLYHEFGFNSDIAAISDSEKAQVFAVFEIMREIAGEMVRRRETAEDFLAED